MITLLNQYKDARRGLSAMLKELGNTERDKVDKSHINSMINETSFIIEWIDKGSNPDEMRGIDKHSAYHLKYLSNMDVLPDITDRFEREEPDITDEQVKTIQKLMSVLSDRERDCFILHVAQGLSMGDVANELSISKASVQTYIKRAKEKVKEIT